MGSNHELWVPEIPEMPNMEGACAGRSRIEGYSTFSSSPTATSPTNAVTTRSPTWVLVGIWVTVGVPEITPVLDHQRRHPQASRTFTPRPFLSGVRVLLAALNTR